VLSRETIQRIALPSEASKYRLREIPHLAALQFALLCIIITYLS
jgi:hypothetical protein